MIVVRQLGNGGTFDYNQPNTAFTLYDDQILVDCGYSIFPVLLHKDLDGSINHVFATHAHDDHIGSLETFLYWYEIHDAKVKAFFPEDVYEVLMHKNKLGGDLYQYPNQERPFESVRISHVSPNIILPEIGVTVRSLTQRTHGHFINTSYTFDIPVNSKRNLVRIAISGDTKANKAFERFVFEDMSDDHVALVIFHDFSYWNHPNNPHATEYDFDLIYSDRFKKHTVKVHTGDTNFKEIYTIDDLLENFSLK